MIHASPDTLPADPPLDELFSAAYAELAAPRFKVFSPLHFRRIVARAMRQVLVDAARRRNAAKRGGDLVFVQLDEAIAGGVSSAGDIVALDCPLDSLGRLNPRQAEMVGLPLLRRARHRRNRGGTRCLRSHGAARLEGGACLAGQGCGRVDSARWERVQTIFHETGALPPEERPGFVAAAAGADHELAADVLSASTPTRSGCPCSTVDRPEEAAQYRAEPATP